MSDKFDIETGRYDELPVHMNFEAYMGLMAEKNASEAKVRELEQALCMLYDKYEDGPCCTEDGDPHGTVIGNAVRLSADEEDQILRLIPAERDALHATDKAAQK